jgi:hypothetical protein
MLLQGNKSMEDEMRYTVTGRSVYQSSHKGIY